MMSTDDNPLAEKVNEFVLEGPEPTTYENPEIEGVDTFNSSGSETAPVKEIVLVVAPLETKVRFPVYVPAVKFAFSRT